MQKLTPQQKQIIGYLNDGEWHCMASADFYMKDDRTRISELRKIGYSFQEEPCDSRAQCKVKHSSRLYMRRLISAPPQRTLYIKDPLSGQLLAVQ